MCHLRFLSSGIAPAILAALCALAYLAGNCVTLSAEPMSDEGFSLSSQVVTAIENGPVIVKYTLKYDGFGAKTICAPKVNNGAGIFGATQVVVPDSWTQRSRFFLFIGQIGGPPEFVKINPGWRVTEYRYLHVDYVGIRADETTLSASWPISSVENGREKVVAEPTCKTVIRAGPLSVKSLRDFENALRLEARESAPLEDKRALLKLVRNSLHAELLPSIAKALEPIDDPKVTREIVSDIYQLASSNRLAKENLLKYLMDKDPSLGVAIVTEIAVRSTGQKDPLLSANDISALSRAPSLLLRAAIWCEFPDQFAEDQKAGTIRELSNIVQPVPTEEFCRMFARLESDKYAERINAAKDLLSLGERAGTQLRRSLLAPGLSADSASRIKSILATIEKSVPDRLTRDSISLFDSVKSPESTRILIELSRNMPGTWITSEATAILKRRR